MLFGSLFLRDESFKNAFAKIKNAKANFYFAPAFSENIGMFEGIVEEEIQILLQQFPH